MTTANLMVLGILAVAVILFVNDRLRVDLVAMLVLVALMLTGLLTPEEAFSGFASPAVVTVWAVFIISGALFRSGVADNLARYVLRLAGRDPLRLLIVIMLTVGVMSAFMNNIGAVAILLPAVVTISRQLRIAPSRLLMPLAFAALLGGNMTLIGTPPNILASSILQDYGGVEPFRFFGFLPTGIMVLTAGILYMVLVGRHLLPDRSADGELSDAYPVREYLTEVRIGPGSSLMGQTVSQTGFGEQYDLTVLHVRRDGDERLAPTTDHQLQAGDVLLLKGPLRDILAVSQAESLHPVGEWTQVQEWRRMVADQDLKLAEATLAPQSSLVGKTLKEIDFRARHGLSVLAIQRDGRSLVYHLGDVSLSFGDALLIQGTPDKINLLRADPDFLVLDTPPIEMRRMHKAPLAVAILLGALIVVTMGWLHVSTVMLIGALLMIISGVLTMDEAYQAIDWQSVFLIAGMLPLGIAMEETGTARLLADQIVGLVGELGPLAVLGGIFVLTALLTEVISNAAATVLMVPIAIDAATSVGANAHPFVMTAVLAASTSFLMPVGHQVNVIIFGPGGYKFSDYTKVGVWLNLLMLVLVVTLLPLIWPLYP